MRAPVARLGVRAPQAAITALGLARPDLLGAGNVRELVLEAVAGAPTLLEVTVELRDEADAV